MHRAGVVTNSGERKIDYPEIIFLVTELTSEVRRAKIEKAFHAATSIEGCMRMEGGGILLADILSTRGGGVASG